MEALAHSVAASFINAQRKILPGISYTTRMCAYANVMAALGI